MGFALARLPSPQLGVQVVQWQAQQARHVGLHARQARTMALGAGRKAPRGIALRDQLLAFGQAFGRNGVARRGLGVGQLQARKIPGHFTQIVIRQRIDQAGHQIVMTTTLSKITQLVMQVARRFTGQAGVVAIGPCTTLLSMTSGTGPGAFRHVVCKTSPCRRGGAGSRVGRVLRLCSSTDHQSKDSSPESWPFHRVQ